MEKLWYYGKKTMVLWEKLWLYRKNYGTMEKTMVLWKNYGTSIYYTKTLKFLNKYIALELKRFIMEKIWNF